MSVEENKALIRRFFERVTAQDASVYDELWAAEVRYNGQVTGTAAIKHLSTVLNAAFHDRQDILEDLIAEGDRVAARWTWRATHSQDFVGPTVGRIPATGKPVTMSGINIYRIADGRIVESWEVSDRLDFIQQLGVIPAPGQAAADANQDQTT